MWNGHTCRQTPCQEGVSCGFVPLSFLGNIVLIFRQKKKKKKNSSDNKYICQIQSDRLPSCFQMKSAFSLKSLKNTHNGHFNLIMAVNVSIDQIVYWPEVIGITN